MKLENSRTHPVHSAMRVATAKVSSTPAIIDSEYRYHLANLCYFTECLPGEIVEVNLLYSLENAGPQPETCSSCSMIQTMWLLY